LKTYFNMAIVTWSL